MRIQNPQGTNLNNLLLLSESTIMISHGLPDLWERVKLQMTST